MDQKRARSVFKYGPDGVSIRSTKKLSLVSCVCRSEHVGTGRYLSREIRCGEVRLSLHIILSSLTQLTASCLLDDSLRRSWRFLICQKWDTHEKVSLTQDAQEKALLLALSQRLHVPTLLLCAYYYFWISTSTVMCVRVRVRVSNTNFSNTIFYRVRVSNTNFSNTNF